MNKAIHTLGIVVFMLAMMLFSMPFLMAEPAGAQAMTAEEAAEYAD